jgi:hypothetical protein
MAGLGWALVSHRLTGPRVRVEVVGARFGDRGALLADLEGVATVSSSESGYQERAVGLRVFNRGRTATSIDSWSLAIGPGAAYTLPEPPNRPLPHRLEPNSSEVFLSPARFVSATVATLARSNMPATYLQGVVNLGDGTTVTTKPIQVPKWLQKPTA